MSATKDERLNAEFTRDNVDTRAAELGHIMTWQLSPTARRRGYVYSFDGTCTHCGAQASASAGASTSHGPRDARHEPCSGPGTTVLTDIEAERLSELVAGAVSDFGAAVAASQLTAYTDHSPDALRWIIDGPAGEMEFRLAPNFAAVIHPLNVSGDRDCEITQGDEVALLWQGSGQDDAVVWSELQHRYQPYL